MVVMRIKKSSSLPAEPMIFIKWRVSISWRRDSLVSQDVGHFLA
jgi:hypothetical protein